MPLFRRLNRRIELTAAGAAFLPVVRQAMDLLEKSASQVAQETRKAPLVVSCLATFMMRWLIPKLYAFNAANPGIELRLSASHAPVKFEADGIDVAIRTRQAAVAPRRGCTPLLSDRIGPVLSPGLLERGRVKRPADLRRLPLTAYADATSRLGRLAAHHRCSGGRREPLVPHFEHTYFLLEAAASGLGVAIGSYPLVQHDLESGRLVAPSGLCRAGIPIACCTPGSRRSREDRGFPGWIAAETRHRLRCVRASRRRVG